MAHRGHLFITAGDLRRLACDAVLVPTDREFRITRAFRPLVGLKGHDRLTGVRWSSSPVIHLGRSTGPAVWLGNVGRAGPTDTALHADVARTFVEQAAKEARARLKRRPVLALPVLGTGEGGQAQTKGGVYETLIPALTAAANRHSADVVLVTYQAKAYAAAQRVRQRLGLNASGWSDDPFDLGPAKRDHELSEAADSLATEARRGRLVLFLGAGISAGAGLPTWQQLLDRLVEDLQPRYRPDRGALRRLDFRDQATVLRNRYQKAGRKFDPAMRRALKSAKHGLTHELLASLPTTEAVTTNYDQLLEEAVRATGDDLAVLPGEPYTNQRRWLLKLHGDIEDPTSVVLSRQDYLQAPLQRGALFGMVQAMLMTRHMLFVGYSLSDEDFHQLVDEVRSARRHHEEKGPFGTVLTLFEDELFAELWGDDLRIVAMAEPPRRPGKPTPTEMARAARRLQIFLDLVGFRSAGATAFLLDTTYSDMLSDSEKALVGTLRRLDGLRRTDPDGPWDAVDRLLSEFGLTGG